MMAAAVTLIAAIVCVQTTVAVELGLQPVIGTSCSAPINNSLCDLGAGTVSASLAIANGKNKFNFSSEYIGIRISVRQSRAH